VVDAVRVRVPVRNQQIAENESVRVERPEPRLSDGPRKPLRIHGECSDQVGFRPAEAVRVDPALFQIVFMREQMRRKKLPDDRRRPNARPQPAVNHQSLE
jgi:hypothetical protein